MRNGGIFGWSGTKSLQGRQELLYSQDGAGKNKRAGGGGDGKSLGGLILIYIPMR
jgi:hypothetical protein